MNTCLTARHPVHVAARCRAWFELPHLPGVPLEPYFKVFFTFVGICGELWVGQKSFTCVA